MLNELKDGDIKRVRAVRKGEVLLRPGDTAKHGYIVRNGCLRAYVIDAAGKEHVLQFAPEDWAIGDMKATIQKEPATLFVDALEDSEVLEVQMDLMEERVHERPELASAIMNKLRRNIVALNERIVDLMAATGEERYLRFMATYPGLFQRLPQKLIASYLGLTPESLSRIRKGIAKGGNGMHSGPDRS